MLSLREVRSRMPPITLKPRTTIIIGSSPSGSSYRSSSSSSGSCTLPVTNVVDHPHLAAVQCKITVGRDGTALLFHDTPFAQTTPHAGYPARGTTYLKQPNSVIAPIAALEDYRRGSGTTLQSGDIISFSTCLNAPSFVVVDERITARNGSPCNLSLLEIDENLLLSHVLPCLPLAALARLALTSAETATLVAIHLVDSHRWGTQSVNITKVLGEVSTRQELISAAIHIVSSHVNLGEKSLWQLVNYQHKEYDSRYWDSRYSVPETDTFARIPRIEAGSEQNGAAHLLMKIIPREERRQLGHVFSALAVRMMPAQLVALLTTLQKTGLGEVWPHGYRGGATRHSRYEPDDCRVVRLQADQICWGTVAQCSKLSAWTPELLVSLGKAIGSSGFELGSHFNDSGLADDPTAIKSVVDLWTCGLDDDHANEFIIGFHRFGDNLREAFDSILDLALDEEYSLARVLGLVGMLDTVAYGEADQVVTYDDWGREEREQYYSIPSEFLTQWSREKSFPVACSLEEIDAVMGCIARLTREAQEHFYSLRLAWISELVPEEGAMAANQVDKLRALS